MKMVLIIDDDKPNAELIAQTVGTEMPGVDCEIVIDFSQAETRIGELKPDAVVLDLMEGGPMNLPGEITWRSVWNNAFCPIIIYSGSDADLTPPVPSSHPFIRRITKRGGAEKLVVEALKQFVPATNNIQILKDEVDAVIQRVLRDTAGEGHISPANPTHLLHAGRRRLAACMDAPTVMSKHQLVSWEQYLIPPIGESPLNADLLRIREANQLDLTAYRLLLTPSCDLVNGRSNKNVLLAKCLTGAYLVHVMSLSCSTKTKKRLDSIDRFRKGALTPGVCDGYVALPEFPGKIPFLTANLKDLEVVPYTDIVPDSGNEPKLERIASIDSPFREQIAWAYLTTAARPGMPDRDLDSWADEVIELAAITANKPESSDTSVTAPQTKGE